MKVTIEIGGVTASVESLDTISIEDCLEMVIKPALLGVGFSPKNVECIGYIEPIDEEVLN